MTYAVTSQRAATPRGLTAGLMVWAAAIIIFSLNGAFAAIAKASAPAYGIVIALGIAIPTLLYFVAGPFRRTLDAISMRNLTLLHIPRIGGGAVFLFYGWAGNIPPLLAVLVGFGDIISGLAASIILVKRNPSPADLRTIHSIGLTDFGVGLSTGMTLGLLGDPRLVPLAEMPLSLILLWWVGVLATSHIVVLARLTQLSRA